MPEHICTCGNLIESSSRGRPRKFCLACRPRKQNRHPQHQKPKFVKPKLKHPCVVCGTAITGNSQVCSDKCKWKIRPRKPCVVCDGPTGWSATDQRAVSGVCRQCQRILSPKKPESVTKWVCRNCGIACQRDRVGGMTPKYCGKRCQNLAVFYRRRARLKNAFIEDVNRLEVFLADGYKCYLCGEKTDPSKSHPHPKAPTIDHVIPLNKGGLHERANCRTACARCNSAKQDRGGGEQFALVL